MSKVKYLAATECTIDGKLFQPGHEVPFANARMIESGMVKCVLDEAAEAAEPAEAPADEAEVLTEKSSDVEVLTEDSDEESEESEEE